MKSIDKKTVERVAHLSRLELGETEVEQYCAQLALILSYISKLNEIDTSKTQPTSHALSTLKNVFRKDIPKASITPEEALDNAPAKDGDLFRVPPVIGAK